MNFEVISNKMDSKQSELENEDIDHESEKVEHNLDDQEDKLNLEYLLNESEHIKTTLDEVFDARNKEISLSTDKIQAIWDEREFFRKKFLFATAARDGQRQVSDMIMSDLNEVMAERNHLGSLFHNLQIHAKQISDEKSQLHMKLEHVILENSKLRKDLTEIHQGRAQVQRDLETVIIENSRIRKQLAELSKERSSIVQDLRQVSEDRDKLKSVGLQFIQFMKRLVPDLFSDNDKPGSHFEVRMERSKYQELKKALQSMCRLLSTQRS